MGLVNDLVKSLGLLLAINAASTFLPSLYVDARQRNDCSSTICKGDVVDGTHFSHEHIAGEGHFCFFEGTEIDGYDLQTEQIPRGLKSKDDCRDWCLKHKDCDGFTYVEVGFGACKRLAGLCFFKQGSNLRPTKKTVGMTSGHAQCSSLSCVKTGLAFNPNHPLVSLMQTVQDVASFEECQMHCLTFEGCKMMTWNGIKSQCLLFDANYTTDGQVKALSHATTIKPGSAVAFRACDIHLCYQPDVIYRGKLLITVNAFSATECQAQCNEDNVDCKLFTYNGQQTRMNCKLFGSFTKAVKAKSLGKVSGPRCCCYGLHTEA